VIHQLDTDETYGIVEALRLEALASEVNRRRAAAGDFALVGQPFVSGAFICQAYLTAPKTEDLSK
jgi:hypothetical protein